MKVLIFAPHAGILQHSRAERDLGLCFHSLGWDVVIVGCRGALGSFCNVITANSFAPRDAQKVTPQLCGGCRSASDRLFGQVPNFRTLSIEDFIANDDTEFITGLLAAVNQDNWESTSLDGLPVGRLAAYELLLTHKLHTRSLPASVWSEYLEMLRSVLVSATACTRVLDAETPDRVIVYNSLYGVNGVWKRTAESRRIPTFALQFNILAPRIHDSLMIYRDDGTRCAINHSTEARRALSTPLSKQQVLSVHDSLVANLRATNLFVYSKGHEGLLPSETRRCLGIDAVRPVVLVPLSSEDERFAAALVDVEIMAKLPSTFPTQLDLVRFIAKLAERRPDLQFVVRIHPRMFPNRREGVEAPAAEELMQVLQDGPANVRVNTPDQDLSLMDVAQISSVCLAGRSSVGAQLGAFGIPLIIHDPEVLTALPPNLGQVVNSQEEFEAAIDQQIARPLDLESIIRAYRWLSFTASGLSVDVSSRSAGVQIGSAAKPGLPLSISKQLRRLAMKLPLRVQALMKARRIAYEAGRMDPPDPAILKQYELLVRVVTEELDYVPQVLQALAGDPAEEDKSVRSSLRSLLAILGEFNDPSCLSSRLRQTLETVDSSR